MERLTTTRRAKWKYPPASPQPAPKILHLPPHRPTRKAPKPKASPSKLPPLHNDSKGKTLVNLFDQERSFTRGVDPMVLVSPGDDEEMRRKRVVEEESRENDSFSLGEEEKWRFQAEVLRAECNLLRMERDIDVRKTERTLKSVLQALVHGRNSNSEGKNVRLVLEEKIDELSKNSKNCERGRGLKTWRLKNVATLMNKYAFSKGDSTSSEEKKYV